MTTYNDPERQAPRAGADFSEADQYRDLESVVHQGSETDPDARMEVKRRAVESILRQYPEVLAGGYEVIPVGDKGFVIKLQGEPPSREGDWALVDLDDTMIAYSSAKTNRLAAYTKLADEQLELHLDPALYERVLNVTDQFSRWDEQGAAMYHVNAHLSAASWLTEQIKANPEDATRIIDQAETRLADIKEGRARDDDPFYMSGNRLVLRHSGPWSKDLENVFMHSMVHVSDEPDTMTAYLDAMSSMRVLGRPAEGDPKVNIAAFTYGEPHFQIRKMLELMQSQFNLRHPLPVSEIWLTEVGKGQFLEELAEQQSTSEAFNPEPHVVVLADDDPKQLDSLLRVREEFRGQSGPMIGVLRSIRGDTKTERRPWDYHPGPSGELGMGKTRTHIFSESGRIGLANELRNAFVDDIGEVLEHDYRTHELDAPTRESLVRRYNSYVDHINEIYEIAHRAGRTDTLFQYGHITGLDSTGKWE